MPTVDDILQLIDVQVRNLIISRAMLPLLRSNLVGATAFPTAPFYRNRGWDVAFSFRQPLTEQTIQDFNSAGRWVNESFVIRLYALLEANDIIPKEGKGKIDQRLEGYEAIDILRRLRQQYAHSPGHYDPSDTDKRRLFERIVKTYSLEDLDPDTADVFPVPIDKFLIPMANGCKRYVLALAQRESTKK